MTKELRTASGGFFTPYEYRFSAAPTAGPYTFAPRSDYQTANGPYDVAIGDLDGDGGNDIVSVNYSSGNVSILKNDGNGKFSPHVDYSCGSIPYALLLVDLDNDGDLDIAVSNSSTQPSCEVTGSGSQSSLAVAIIMVPLPALVIL